MRIQLSDDYILTPKRLHMILGAAFVIFPPLAFVFFYELSSFLDNNPSSKITTDDYGCIVILAVFIVVGLFVFLRGIYVVPTCYQIEFDDNYLYIQWNGSEVKVPLENISNFKLSWYGYSGVFGSHDVIYILINEPVNGKNKVAFLAKRSDKLTPSIYDAPFLKDLKGKIEAKKAKH